VDVPIVMISIPSASVQIEPIQDENIAPDAHHRCTGAHMASSSRTGVTAVRAAMRATRGQPLDVQLHERSELWVSAFANRTQELCAERATRAAGAMPLGQWGFASLHGYQWPNNGSQYASFGIYLSCGY
jgi:hypothetical protein